MTLNGQILVKVYAKVGMHCFVPCFLAFALSKRICSCPISYNFQHAVCKKVGGAVNRHFQGRPSLKNHPVQSCSGYGSLYNAAVDKGRHQKMKVFINVGKTYGNQKQWKTLFLKSYEHKIWTVSSRVDKNCNNKISTEEHLSTADNNY